MKNQGGPVHFCNANTVSPPQPPVFTGATSQDCLGDACNCRQYWTVYILQFVYTYISMIKFPLEIWHSERLTTLTQNKIEELPQYTVMKGMWGKSLFRERVTWTQVLWYCDSWSDRWDGYQTATKGDVTCPVGEWHGVRGPLAAHNGMQFKTCKLFPSGIFHLVFSRHGWLQITGTADSETVGQGELLCEYVSVHKATFKKTSVETAVNDIKSLIPSLWRGTQVP